VLRLTVCARVMATLSSAIIKGLAEDYTRVQLAELRRAATDAVMNNLPRVEITGANYDVGGQSGEFVQGKPELIAEYCQAAIEHMDSCSQRNDSIVFGDFSNRPAAW